MVDVSTAKQDSIRKNIKDLQQSQVTSNQLEFDSLAEQDLIALANLVAQKAFNKSEMRYRRLFETAHDGILILDFKYGRIIDANPFILKLLGSSIEDALGKELWEIGIFDDIEASKAAFQVLKQEGYLRYENLPLHSPDGVIHEVEFISNSYMDGAQHVIQCNIRDISERRVAEEKLAQSQEMFNQAQKMEAIGVLVGGIAHDFNNVLAGITGNTYLAKSEINEHPERLQERLETIEALSFRSAELIKQLLTFSRRDMVDMHPLELTSLIKEAFKLIRSGIPEHININLDYPEEIILVNGDVTQIHQILMNLMNNAKDAVEHVKEPSITVALDVVDVDAAKLVTHPSCQAGKYARMRVEDNNGGIPEEHLQHLFEPFFTTKAEGKGTGLGLSMVFGAVENHHGFIEVTSKKDTGSIFEVYLPMTQTTVVTQQKETTSYHGNGELILIVDDEKALADITAQLVEKMGYHVLIAHDGLEAIEVFKAHQAAIRGILMDVIMPKCGGVEAADRIRKHAPDIGIIFATGYDQLKVTHEHIVNPSDAVLTKPYNVEALAKAISHIIDS